MSDETSEIVPVEPTVTDRGFKRYEPVESRYGGHIRVYESSLADAPHIWVTSTAPSNLNDPTGPQVEAPMHLTLANAVVLRDQLTHLIENHYQEVDRG
ncbi:MAG: hypothetical protein JWO15_3878 [Sphingomonadales bacterium]|nr:hypothetical protein [Sphingomonadales bacterium]